MTLDIQQCQACSRFQYYPKPVCGSCGSIELVLVPASGGGSLYSYTVVHRAPVGDIETPYVVAVVRLDEGPSLLTHLVACTPSDLRCDLRVRLQWDTTADGQPLAVFAPS